MRASSTLYSDLSRDSTFFCPSGRAAAASTSVELCSSFLSSCGGADSAATNDAAAKASPAVRHSVMFFIFSPLLKTGRNRRGPRRRPRARSKRRAARTPAGRTRPSFEVVPWPQSSGLPGPGLCGVLLRRYVVLRRGLRRGDFVQFKPVPLHPAERIVLHADLDAFYASVEERDDPALQGQPVVVGSDPRGGAGRGIVATCNYAARKFGVRSAMPISIAFKRCPQAVYLRPDFRRYSAASRRVMDILRAAADVFEQAGVDEAYADVSSCGTFENARALALGLQSRIKESERLSVSFGVAPNKLLAKLGSDHKKPGGVTVVIPSRVEEFLDPKDVGVLRGVGPVTRAALAAQGWETVAELRRASEARLGAVVGSFGPVLWREARGLDDRPVDPVTEAKSVGREHTFDSDTGDADEVRGTLRACVRRVHRDLGTEGLWCRTLTVKVRFEGYETHSKQTTLRLPTARLDQLESVALELLEPFLGEGRRFRLVGFSVGKLSPPEDVLPLG
ncbi:DNA polymerase IV [bacterium]|nr:MAG: DNA polymerase IV [bacterium]